MASVVTYTTGMEGNSGRIIFIELDIIYNRRAVEYN